MLKENGSTAHFILPRNYEFPLGPRVTSSAFFQALIVVLESRCLAINSYWAVQKWHVLDKTHLIHSSLRALRCVQAALTGEPVWDRGPGVMALESSSCFHNSWLAVTSGVSDGPFLLFRS